MKTKKRHYRLARCQIGFVKFILEAYDNVAVLSTLDSQQGVVQVTIAPGCETLVSGILTSLAREFTIVPIDDVPLARITDDHSKLPT